MCSKATTTTPEKEDGILFRAQFCATFAQYEQSRWKNKMVAIYKDNGVAWQQAVWLSQPIWRTITFSVWLMDAAQKSLSSADPHFFPSAKLVCVGFRQRSATTGE